MSVFTLKDEDEENEHETKADPERLCQMAHPVAERLDILLSMLLSYIKDVCYVDGNNL
jgi:RNA polymerase I-specific transcription initiation factor RRN3